MSHSIYYSASVRGAIAANDTINVFEILARYGTVLTAHMQNPATVDGGRTNAQIFKTDMALLDKATVFVANVTNPSLGVGYTIARAQALNKQIVCVCSAGVQVSAMIAGTLPIYYYKSAQDLDFILYFTLACRSSILLLGPPGSGKSTIGRKLQETFGIKHVSTGDIVRSVLADPANPLKPKIQSFVERGELIPATNRHDCPAT